MRVNFWQNGDIWSLGRGPHTENDITSLEIVDFGGHKTS